MEGGLPQDGRVLTGDLYDVCGRLREIDGGYVVVRRRGRFEVHNRDDRPTYCLTLPYDKLDERCVELVRKTRAERAQALFDEMDKENEALRRKALCEAAERAQTAVEQLAGRTT